MNGSAPRITVSPARRYRVAAGHRWPVDVRPAPGELLSSWLHRLAHANGVPPRYFGAVLGVAGETWSAQLDRHLPDSVRRLLLDHTSICPTRSTVFVWPTVHSRPCACGCGPGRKMQGHRRRSPVGCSSVPPAWGKTRCPISGGAGPWQPACPAFAMAAACATVARLVGRALRHFVRLASCHNSTAPSATPLSQNRLARQARAPGASSG